MHYPVLVVTEDKPTEAMLEEILVPWLFETAENEETRDRMKPPGPQYDYWRAGGWYGHLLTLEPYPEPDTSIALMEWGSIQKRNFPIAALRERAARRAADTYDRRKTIIGPLPLPDYDRLTASHGEERARALFWNDPALIALRNAKEEEICVDEIAILAGTREAAIAHGLRRTGVADALVKSGTWHQHTEWRTKLYDEPNALSAWVKAYWDLLDDVAPEHWLVAIDCHT